MSARLPRRGFLRDVVASPVIGGSVALLGRTTAAAVSVTDALHERYLAWLTHEHSAAVEEHAWRSVYITCFKSAAAKRRRANERPNFGREPDTFAGFPPLATWPPSSTRGRLPPAPPSS